MKLSHFYHVYADGDWPQAVTEHCLALTRTGLMKELGSWFVGFVGTDENVKAVRCTLDVLAPRYEVCAHELSGFEQVTLDQVYAFVQDHDGLISYAHTKGAAFYNPVNEGWRRSMEYHNFVDWRTPVAALESGKTIAGCHWMNGGPSSIPGYGHGGMFGGNYWWTHCDKLRLNVPPGHESRFAAEHWLGQLSEVMPITPETICDLNTQPITVGYMSNWI